MNSKTGIIYFFKNLLSGLCLIAAASFILIASDNSGARKPSDDVKRIAVFQFASRPTLDESVAGCLDKMAARGLKNGGKVLIKKFNAENDSPAANAIAREITMAGFDMVITMSTPALQIMANANKETKLIHIFGTVTDPAGAGVGITYDGPYSHPAHMAGVGTFQPVEKLIAIIKEINPSIKSLGTPWALSEKCSEACVLKARKTCASLGITLVEMPVEGSTAVLEASRALLQKGVEAIWVGGDNVVEIAIDSVVKAAAESNIPVFTNNPDHAEKGAYASLGANYYQVGETVGEIASDVIYGKPAAKVPIENIVPENLVINLKKKQNLSSRWKLTDALIKRAAKIIKQ